MMRKILYATTFAFIILMLVPAVRAETKNTTRTTINGTEYVVASFTLSPGTYRVTAPADFEGLVFDHWEVSEGVTVSYPFQISQPNVVDVNVTTNSGLYAYYTARAAQRLSTPTPLKPVNVTVLTRQVQFEWTSVPNATGYEVKLYAETTQTYSISSTTMVLDNVPNGDYFWEVRATAGSDWLPSYWSSLVNFEVSAQDNFILAVATFDTDLENILHLGVTLDGFGPFSTPLILPVEKAVFVSLAENSQWGYGPKVHEFNVPALIFVGGLGAILLLIGLFAYTKGERRILILSFSVLIFFVLLIVLTVPLYRTKPATIWGAAFYRWDTGDPSSMTTLDPSTPMATALFDHGDKSAIVVMSAAEYVYQDRISYRIPAKGVIVEADYTPIGETPTGIAVTSGTEHTISVPQYDADGNSFSYWLPDLVTDATRKATGTTLVAVYGSKTIPSEPILMIDLPTSIPGPRVDYSLITYVAGAIAVVLAIIVLIRWRRGIL